MSALVPRPGIMEIAPYVPGDSEIPGIAHPIKLASNENPLGASENAIAAYRALAHELHLYPDGAAVHLREAIGRRFGMDPARIVCGAGSDELLSLLGRAYAGPGDEVIHTRHAFAIYRIVAQTVGARPVEVPETNLTANVDAILAHVTPRTRMVYLANPNNPTGSYLPQKEIERLRAGLPANVLLVLDAAYAEYVQRNDYEPGRAMVDAHDNVVMTRTFSKIHGLAALRLGWAYCPPEVADVLNRVRGPFNVTAAAIAAGVASVSDPAHEERSRAHNTEWLARFVREVEALGLVAHPSVCNFLLVEFPTEPGKDAEAALRHLMSRGVIPRRMTGYGLPACLRISIGLPEEMEKTVAALAEFVGK